MAELVTDIQQVTPAWLDNLLREKGILDRGMVIEVRPTRSKKTNVSTVYHLAVSYQGLPPDHPAPRHLFLKISEPDYGWPQEAQFYNVVAPAMLSTDPDTEWPFVRCYDAVYSAEKKATHLLLQDLSATHLTTEGLMPPAPRHAEQVIDAYALLHAYWWEHPRLGRDIGRLLTHGEIDDFLTAAGRKLRQLVDDMGAGLSPEDRGVLESVAAAWPARRRERLVAGVGVTLVHRDPHPLNFLYPRDPERGGVKLIDWQSWRVDAGTDDLAYLMACHWPIRRGESLEPDLVRRYHARLVELGVAGYSWDDCRYDYCASVVRCVFFLIVAWAPGRWERLKRGIEAFKRWDCARLFAG